MDGGKRPERENGDKGKRKATRRSGAPERRLDLDSDEEETGKGRGRGMVSYRGRGRGAFSSTEGAAGSSNFNPQNNGAGYVVNPSNAGMIPENLQMDLGVNQGALETGIDIADFLFGVPLAAPPPVPPPVPPAAPPAAPPPERQGDEPEE